MYKIVIGSVVFIVTLIGCGVSLYTTFNVPLVRADQEEKKERIAADMEITKEIELQNRQAYACMADIRIMLAELRTDIAYVKKEVSK